MNSFQKEKNTSKLVRVFSAAESRNTGNRKIFLVLFFIWAGFILLCYYKKIWHLLLFYDPSALMENYSLSSLLKQLRLMKNPSNWLFAISRENLLRTLNAIWGSGLVLVATQLPGFAICRLLKWNPENWRERLLFQTGLGVGALAYILLGLAVLGIYTIYYIKLIVYVSILGLLVPLFSYFTNSAEKKVAPLTEDLQALPYHGDCYQSDWVWKTIVIFAVLMALITALSPEQEYDALWYHLGFPRIWLESGYLKDLPAEYVSLYPMTWELIFGAGLALGGPVAAKLLHLACLPLLSLLVYQLTLRWIGGVSPWVPMAFLVSIPTVLWEASTAYIDLALAFHVGLGIYSLLLFIEEDRPRWLALAAISLGFGTATKHLGLFALAAAGAMLTWQLWLKTHNLRRTLVPPVLLALTAFGITLFWYYRSYLASGNPVFPELFGLFGASPERWDQLTQRGLNSYLENFGRPRTLMNLILLPWDVTIHAARYGGSLGPLFLLLFPALALTEGSGWTIRWLIRFMALYMALWASPFSSFQLRFLVPIMPIMAILAGEAYRCLAMNLKSTVPRSSMGALRGALVLLMFLNLPPFTSLHEVDRPKERGWLTHVIHRIPIEIVLGKETEREYLTAHVPSYAAWRHINENLPDNTRILTFSGGDHFYSERDRIWSNATMARPAVWGSKEGQEPQALDALMTLGITHILFDKKMKDDPEVKSLAIMQSSMFRNRYHLEYADDRFDLYCIRWEGMPCPASLSNPSQGCLGCMEREAGT